MGSNNIQDLISELRKISYKYSPTVDNNIYRFYSDKHQQGLTVYLRKKYYRLLDNKGFTIQTEYYDDIDDLVNQIS